MLPRRVTYTCTICKRTFKSSGGLTYHVNRMHRPNTPPPDADHNQDDAPVHTEIKHPHFRGQFILVPRLCEMQLTFYFDSGSM